MTPLETLEAAAILGRRLEKLSVDKAAAHREWQERLEARYAKKRAELIAAAPPEVLEKLGVVA